jgi:DNA-binding CsgD family transcriptional regulator
VGSTIAERRSRPNVVLLDAEFTICLAHPGPEPLGAEEFRRAARRIVGERLDHLDVTAGGARYRVRIARLRGPDPMRYAMFVERRGSRRPLLEAYDRFGLSAREIDVLSLIVDGASNREIAETLSIVPGTVQDHVRSICAKSGAKRRGDLLARVFGVHEP